MFIWELSPLINLVPRSHSCLYGTDRGRSGYETNLAYV